ncbi:MAG: KpsF/GutQ family sugar-phosphate isomerase [Thermodesulfobacteriota bacterium]
MNEQVGNNWIKLAENVLDIEIQGLEEVKRNLGPDFYRAVEMIAGSDGRVVVAGIGKSGLVGRKIAATLSSTGTAAFFLHPVEGAHGDLGMIREGDVVITISNSGETDELNAIIPTLRSLGAKIISLTSNLESTMAGMSDVIICTRVPKEACTLGLAPTSSTTATLAVGDALAVCLIERKSFGKEDFQRYHPGGDLGKQLRQDISRIMHTADIPIVHSGTSLNQSLQVLDKGRLGTVVVLDSDSKLLGILTDGDVRRLLCREEYSPEDPVDSYMTINPLYAVIGQKGGMILDVMEKSAILVLPVVDENKVLQGVVHLHDLLGKGSFDFSKT